MKKKQYNVMLNEVSIHMAQKWARNEGTTLSAILRRTVDALATKFALGEIVTQERFRCRICAKDVYAVEEQCIECGNYVIPNQ